MIARMFQQQHKQASELQGLTKKTKEMPTTVSNVKMSDVAGMTGEKQEIQEFITFLTDPERYHKIGAKMPKGVLLTGPPGTGKTLLGKAVANECGVPFYYKTGSEFKKSYVGEGSKAIRDLFKAARANSPAIIYIDEIETLGRKRSEGMSAGDREGDVTLNQLLVEMDGLTNKDEIGNIPLL